MFPIALDAAHGAPVMERAKRIELSSVAWEATALPLSYARGSTGILNGHLSALAHLLERMRDFSKTSFQKPRICGNPAWS